MISVLNLNLYQVIGNNNIGIVCIPLKKLAKFILLRIWPYGYESALFKQTTTTVYRDTCRT